MSSQGSLQLKRASPITSADIDQENENRRMCDRAVTMVVRKYI